MQTLSEYLMHEGTAILDAIEKASPVVENPADWEPWTRGKNGITAPTLKFARESLERAVSFFGNGEVTASQTLRVSMFLEAFVEYFASVDGMLIAAARGEPTPDELLALEMQLSAKPEGKSN